MAAFCRQMAALSPLKSTSYPMKILPSAFAVIAMAFCSPSANAESLYQIPLKDIDGKETTLQAHQGKVLLVVNVASKCGYTRQYDGLEALWQKYKDKGLVVLGFPSNDFGGQEPGTAQEIATFCRLTYDVTFPMFEKVVTKAGTTQSPVYSFLGASGNLPAWNFSKYVIDKQGKIVAFFPSNVTPEDPALRAAIEQALKS